jgi:hypothetical protein
VGPASKQSIAAAGASEFPVLKSIHRKSFIPKYRKKLFLVDFYQTLGVSFIREKGYGCNNSGYDRSTGWNP